MSAKTPVGLLPQEIPGQVLQVQILLRFGPFGQSMTVSSALKLPQVTPDDQGQAYLCRELCIFTNKPQGKHVRKPQPG